MNIWLDADTVPNAIGDKLLRGADTGAPAPLSHTDRRAFAELSAPALSAGPGLTA